MLTQDWECYFIHLTIIVAEGESNFGYDKLTSLKDYVIIQKHILISQ